jgi:hypothetical protein
MKKLLILSALFLVALPATAQGAVRMQDPDDVTLETIDIKSAVVKDYEVPGESFLAFVIESYEPFDCEDLDRSTGQSLGFVSDFPSTPETRDARFRVRCDDAGVYYWTVRFVHHGTSTKYRMPAPDALQRPSDTIVKILVDMDWYQGFSAEVPARWKVVSERRVDSKIAEIDTAPDRGWQDFGFQGSF